MNEKTYCNDLIVKAKEFDRGGEILKCWSPDMKKLCDWLVEHQNERGGINIDIVRRKTPSDKGVTHSIVLNTFQSQQPVRDEYHERRESESAPVREDHEQIKADNLPF